MCNDTWLSEFVGKVEFGAILPCQKESLHRDPSNLAKTLFEAITNIVHQSQTEHTYEGVEKYWRENTWKRTALAAIEFPVVP